MGAQPDLPFVDEHAVSVAAPRDAVWTALERHVGSALARSARTPLPLVLGTRPRAGFAVTAATRPQRLELTGRHRFSRYALVFELDEEPGGTTRVRALTFAVFPRLRGRVYRTLVIGSRLHVVAVNQILRSIRRAGERPT